MSRLSREYKIVAVGIGSLDRSALISKFILDEHSSITDDSYRRQCVIDDEVAILDVLDPVGEEEYAAIREQYIRTAEGFLLIYSITSRDSFNELSRFYEQILSVKGLNSFPAIVVANNCHRENERQVSMDEGRDLAQHFGCKFIETSSNYRINVDEAFFSLVREIRKYQSSVLKPIASTPSEGNKTSDPQASQSSLGMPKQRPRVRKIFRNLFGTRTRDHSLDI